MVKEGKILIVDNNQLVINLLKSLLNPEFGFIRAIRNPNLIPEILAKDDFDIVILSMNFYAQLRNGNEGLFWLEKIKEISNNIFTVLIASHADTELVVKSIKRGADEFILKPWNPERLLTVLLNGYALNKTSGRKENKIDNCQNGAIDNQMNGYATLISTEMIKIMEEVNKVAKTDANILILGENGTGKEIIAREIHRRSNRNNKIFMSVDLGALHDGLFETELFGHAKGAFTDAKIERPGRFEESHGGTLFLDEIGNLPLSQQNKLLTAIEKKIVTRVGSNNGIPVDNRLITATNRDLYEMVEKREFREDLFFRLKTVEIFIPPLRERPDDIVLLSKYFVNKFSRKYYKHDIELTSKSIEKLRRYSWPGNIRELMHTIENAVIMADRNLIDVNDLKLRCNETKHHNINGSLRLIDIEKDAIVRALKKNNNNLTRTALELGITRATLYAKLQKYGIY